MKLHHIGILVKNMERSVAEYAERFGYRAASPIIHDPVQTAFVQFLRAEQEDYLLELIAPDGESSLLRNASRKNVGIHHLCYQVDDIQQAVLSLREKSMLIIREPVEATAFPGRKIAWTMGLDGIPVEFVEKGEDQWAMD